MDYTTQNLAFKVKKALRYIRLYGPSRTGVKIKGQYHMKKRYSALPRAREKCSKQGHVGLIGCGNYAFSNIAYYLKKNYGDVIRAAMDVDIHKAASLFEEYNLCYYTDNASALITDPDIDAVFIASNHATHAEYAIAALQAGKNVHIEKPHVVSEEQLIRLCSAMEHSEAKVLSIGYNRPRSRIGMEIARALNGQAGAAMFNWFVAGHELDPDHWYFRKEEGGRVLGNLCHWTDFVYNLVPKEERYPIVIRPTRWTKSDCDIAVTYVFGNGTIAVITFSAKGHTFEGVREKFSAHRGNVLISMDDFKRLVVENVEKKHTISLRYRDHGHEASICRSYEGIRHPEQAAALCPIAYVWETGQLFLKTRESLEANETISLRPYEDSYPGT